MQNRREFIKGATVFSTAMAAMPSVVSAQGATRTFRVAMIGSGRRASEALANMTEAAKKLGHAVELVAAHDFFLEEAQRRCKQFGCDDKFAFGGGAGYIKMLEVPGIEIVILGAPPAFRPRHLDACVKAGKHVFAEKPIAVDPQGLRLALEAVAAAKAKNLTLVTGNQRRHQGAYMRQALALQKGQLGAIRGGTVYWCGGWGSVRTRKPGVTDAQYMCNNWMNWAQMSGDHIVEQHVHNIDVANWFIGRYPRTAMAVGARTRRVTGNQYDFFSTDFDYGDGLHVHSLCRQVPGASGRIGELFATDVAEISGGGKATRYDGKEVVWENVGFDGNPYVNEHSVLLDSTLNGKALNWGETLAYATAAAVIARISAYTGQIVRLSDILTNTESLFYNMNFSPAALDFETNADGIVLPPEGLTPPDGSVVPLPGKAGAVPT